MADKPAIKLADFNKTCELPYQLRESDFGAALEDLYDLFHDLNALLDGKGLRRIEETVRPAILTGMVSDILAAGLAQHSRVLVPNRFHNGHPDLIPQGQYANNQVQSGAHGVEVKTTRGRGGVDAHGARPGWMCLFRYEVDSVTEPARSRNATVVTEILLAELTLEDFRRNERGELGTRTASPNRLGLAKLRENWIYKRSS